MNIDDNYLKIIQNFIELTKNDPWNKVVKDAMKKFSIFWNQQTIDALDDFLSVNYDKSFLLLSEQAKSLVSTVIYNHLCKQASEMQEDEYNHYIKSIVIKYQKIPFLNIDILAKEANEEVKNKPVIRKRERFFLQKSPRRP